MRLVIGYIAPEYLHHLKEVLSDVQVHRYTICDVFGHSEAKSTLERYRGIEMEVDLHKIVRVEVGLSDEYYQKVVDALLAAGKEGLLGNAKLFVLPLEEVYRLQTGETGKPAIG
jgi:nitrogen regulatory protein PII